MGFPIRTSPDHSLLGNSPRLIAASDVLHHLLQPRHPPYALICNRLFPHSLAPCGARKRLAMHDFPCIVFLPTFFDPWLLPRSFRKTILPENPDPPSIVKVPMLRKHFFTRFFCPWKNVSAPPSSSFEKQKTRRAGCFCTNTAQKSPVRSCGYAKCVSHRKLFSV